MTKAELTSKLDRLLNAINKNHLLIIDNFAFKKLDQKQSEYLYAVVDGRYGNGSIILTCNRSMSNWVGIFPYPIMANALLDRLCHNAHQIIIKGESYRKKKSPTLQNA